MLYRDSVGNTYTRLPSKPPHHTAKGTRAERKYGRNKVKCALYRAQGRREANKAVREARRARWLESRSTAKILRLRARDAVARLNANRERVAA